MKGKRKTTEQYKKELEKVNKKNGTNIKLKDDIEYINSQTKIIHICTCGKEWNVTPNSIIDNRAKSCGLCYSFAQFGIDNIGEDFLERYWDYEKNNEIGIDPWKISYSSIKPKIWIFCQEKEYHGSYDIICNSFVNGHRCGYCKGGKIAHSKDSFGQYLIDMYGKNALELYWDYEKNIVDPFSLKIQAHKIVYIYCQEKDYHESYPIQCDNFINGNRCSFCNPKSNDKVHPLDSLGKILEDKELLSLWSNKNKKSPYEYTPSSNQDVYWKCSEEKHDDYFRSIAESKDAYFRCPSCSNEQRESIMATTLKQVLKYEYPDTIWEYNAGFKTNKNGISRYDIFVPELNNLLIECQSEYHDDPEQQEIDKLKKEYVLNNGYNYLAIDKRDYTPLEAIQLFFPNIKNIPKYVDISKNTIRNWDLEKAQDLLNGGRTYQEVANIIGIKYHSIVGNIHKGLLKKPKYYKIIRSNKSIKIVCLNKENNKLIKVYNSISEAAIDIKGRVGNICSVLKKEAKNIKRF